MIKTLTIGFIKRLGDIVAAKQIPNNSLLYFNHTDFLIIETEPIKIVGFMCDELNTTLFDYQKELLKNDANKQCIIGTRQSGVTMLLVSKIEIKCQSNKTAKILVINPTSINHHLNGNKQVTFKNFNKTKRLVRYLNENTFDLIVIDNFAFSMETDKQFIKLCELLSNTNLKVILGSTSTKRLYTIVNRLGFDIKYILSQDYKTRDKYIDR